MLIGAAGAGKTSLAQALSVGDPEKLLATGAGQAGTTSPALAIEAYHVPTFRDADHLVKMTLQDSVGLDAETEDEMFQTLQGKMQQGTQFNGFIIVTKMERFRQGYNTSLLRLSDTFQASGIESSNVLLVVTHSAPFRDEVQQQYSHEICQQWESWLPGCEQRVVHANFGMLYEMRDPFAALYKTVWRHDREALIARLLEFREPFNVMSGGGDWAPGQKLKAPGFTTHIPVPTSGPLPEGLHTVQTAILPPVAPFSVPVCTQPLPM